MEIVGIMGATYTPAPFPTVSSVTVSNFNGGTCSGGHASVSAIVRATFAIANPDYALYTVKVYKDNGLRKTITGLGTTTDDYTVGGYVLGASGAPFTSHYVWRVDVIRKSDSAVVSTKTAATFINDFVNCSGPA